MQVLSITVTTVSCFLLGQQILKQSVGSLMLSHCSLVVKPAAPDLEMVLRYPSSATGLLGQLWASYLVSLCLSFLRYKIGDNAADLCKVLLDLLEKS